VTEDEAAAHVYDDYIQERRLAKQISQLSNAWIRLAFHWILRPFNQPDASDFRWQSPYLVHGGRVLGSAVGVAGLVLFTWCVALFARVGKGTLAPWDPTRQLVATGPYRYVRNPMILAVATMLAGQALFFGSAALAAWCAVFVIVNHVYFPAVEEPGLERRFGEPYREYQRRVPRWLPRSRRKAPE
jgi:protein-S-isoprenylcysteine O-methyltransferase Ste14